MGLNPLSHRIMMVAAEHNVQQGQVLPEEAFDLLLDEHAGNIGDAFLKLFSVMS